MTEIAPFPVDVPSVVGVAYVAASSGSEDAHETDQLQGSVFTHQPLRTSDAFRVEVRGVSEPYFAVIWEDPDEPARVLITGTRDELGLLPAAWELDEAGVGATLVLVGSSVDPRGRAPAELLEGPVLLKVSLR